MPINVSSATEAVQLIKSGDNIWVHSMAATPVQLISALAEHAKSLVDVTVMQLHLEHADGLADPALFGHLRNRCYFASKSTRHLIKQGRADYVPMFLSEIPKLFRRQQQHVDVALIQVSPPDKQGFCSLGISVEATRAATQSAKTIIAHINPNMPRTHGDAFIAYKDLTVVYQAEEALIETPATLLTAEQQKIGSYIASLIDDGSCLQMGIGAIPDAVLNNLSTHQHLGIHTEMFSNGVLPLIEKSVIDNSRKKIHPGKIVTGFVMGDKRLYNFVDDNPEVAFLDIEYVNNPMTISRNERVVSINSAIQIDLTGQVCADSIGSDIYSGVGGQLDFVLGASFSENGKSIIALPSTAQENNISRIVSTLTAGAGVVTTRAHVDYVVTEYGIAQLHGKSLKERATSLIHISHPKFRQQLSQQAYDLLSLSVN